MSTQPYSFDLWRIVLGDKPPVFLLEVALRTVIIFAYTLLLLRWMGKRGMGNLTPFEFAIIVALGSAVGDPMFYDDVPLTHTMLVITLVIFMQKSLSWLTDRSDVAERWIDSSPRLLVKQGVIEIAAMHDEHFSHEELNESLRREGLRQLGQVELAYLEPSGRVSIIRRRPAKPGLSVLPTGDQQPAEDDRDPDLMCCTACGLVAKQLSPTEKCLHCGNQSWTNALRP